jgi:putative flippase GtrA
MRQPATSSADRVTWKKLARHQIGATMSTAVDFSLMVFCVERLGLSPVTATAIGASMGAATNFFLGRTWVFPRRTGKIHGQAIRYALISLTSAALNTLGEHLASDLAHLQYVFARVLVSIAVSIAWNFPMQRHFVFREGYDA